MMAEIDMSAQHRAYELERAREIGRLRDDVDEVADLMRDNVNQVLANLEKEGELEEKTRKLEQDAKLFQKRSRSLKRRSLWESIKLKVAAGGAASAATATVLLIILL